MSWLRRNFGGLDEDSAEVERERHARAYILQIIRGILMPDKPRNLIHLKSLLKLVNYELSWGHGRGTVAIFTSSSELPIYIPTHNKEFFVNPNIWHVNVPLVVYATIEMHELDRGEEARGLQLHTRRPQRASIHPNTDEASPSLATTQEPTPTIILSMVVPP
ncbi:hypothetical protein Goklo_014077, partial [Gossypium klotzschianum]|nr:hypothetical protein [Gossypium klotzschianum]